MSEPTETRLVALLEKANGALEQSAEVIREMQAELAVTREAAALGHAITAAGKWFDVGEAAKEMSIDIGGGKRLGRNQLYRYLRETKMVMLRFDNSTYPPKQYHQPYQDQVDAGRMKLIEIDTKRHTLSGVPIVERKALISGKGVAYLKAKISAALAEGRLHGIIA